MDKGDARAVFAAGYAQERNRLLAHLVEMLERDPDVVAVWLEGSLGRGTADDLSDLDIGIVMRDERIPGIVADPSAYVRSLVDTCLEIPSPGNAPPRGAFLLTWVAWGDERIPFQVDWYWYEASSAIRPVDAHVVLDRASDPVPVADLPALPDGERDEAIADAIRMALSMIVITAKRIVRGNPWIVASHLHSVDRSRGTAAWMIEHRQRPPYATLREMGLREDVPNTRDGQIALLRAQFADLCNLIALSGQAGTFAVAVDRAARYLDGVLGPRDQDVDGTLGPTSSATRVSGQTAAP